METITNAFMAPFSEEKAALTTPAKTAVVYTLAGLFLGIMLK